MDPFVAEIRIFPFNFAPKGWALCNGQLLPLSRVRQMRSMLGDGVALPLVGSGTDRVFVINNTANPVQLYAAVPASGTADTINGVAGATGIPLAPNSVVVATEAAPGAWSVVGTGEGYSAGLPTVTALNGITAHAGGGQGSATPLPAAINRLTTVATAGDSVVLPAAAPGLQVMVVNSTATSANGCSARQWKPTEPILSSPTSVRWRFMRASSRTFWPH